MSRQTSISSGRIAWAFAVAVLADLIQLPLIAAFDSVALAVPAEAAILFVDFSAFVLTTALLGFHWVLLPSLAIEAIPNLDAFPTWTACVAFIVWLQRQTPTVPKKPRPLTADSNSKSVTDV